MTRRPTISDLNALGLKTDAEAQVSTANALTQQTLRILDLKGFHVWRQNTAAIYDPVKKVFRKGSANKGISDILGFHRLTGLIVAAEIKKGRDKLSKEQTAFLEAVKASGGIALVIRTTADIETLSTIEVKP